MTCVSFRTATICGDDHTSNDPVTSVVKFEHGISDPHKRKEKYNMEKRMRRWYSAVVTMAMSMALGAVASGVSQDAIPALQREARPAPQISIPTTLTGCVARGTATGTYALTDILKEGEATPAARNAPERLTVVLSGTDVDVSKHVGHKVSVTGAYASDERATGARTEKPAAASATREGGKKTTETFTVRSLKMVADSCALSTN